MPRANTVAHNVKRGLRARTCDTVLLLNKSRPLGLDIWKGFAKTLQLLPVNGRTPPVEKSRIRQKPAPRVKPRQD